jgi:ribosomal-protein-alanine acetyltransferase
MELKIETASIKILDELYEIEKQSFTREAFSKRQIATLLADYNSIGLVARVNEKVGGFLICSIDHERSEPFGHILTLDVAPVHRRRGIAQKLLQEVENLLRSKGVRECRLEVREDNAAAINLYEKLGYERIEKLERYYRDVHGLYLRKNLQTPSGPNPESSKPSRKSS